MSGPANSQQVTLAGTSHISLSVSNCASSLQWYSEVLGFQVVMDMRDEGPWKRGFSTHPSGIVLGFTQHEDMSSFSFRNAGVDHVAFSVARRDDLEAWMTRFDTLGVVHSRIRDIEGGALLSFQDLDGIQLEIFYQK